MFAERPPWRCCYRCQASSAGKACSLRVEAMTQLQGSGFHDSWFYSDSFKLWMSSRSKALVPLPVPEQLTASYSPRVTQASEVEGQKVARDTHTAQSGHRWLDCGLDRSSPPCHRGQCCTVSVAHPPCFLASSCNLCSQLQLGFFSTWVSFQIRSTDSRDGNVL